MIEVIITVAKSGRAETTRAPIVETETYKFVYAGTDSSLVGGLIEAARISALRSYALKEKSLNGD